MVAVTASAFDDMRDTIFEAGADGWLRKPCREGEILAEIARLTGVQYRYVTPYARSLSPSAAHSWPVLRSKASRQTLRRP